MIRLSKLTDYGILLMTQMARHPERPVHTARDLAAATRLPQPTVSKILKSLLNNDLLVSHRGIKGGYSLGRPPQEISVDQIITSLEGPIGMTECAGAPGACGIELHCPVAANWRVISAELRRALANLSLMDLICPLPAMADRNRLIAAGDMGSGRTQ